MVPEEQLFTGTLSRSHIHLEGKKSLKLAQTKADYIICQFLFYLI